jgi:hypothetical protein
MSAGCIGSHIDDINSGLSADFLKFFCRHMKTSLKEYCLSSAHLLCLQAYFTIETDREEIDFSMYL